MYCPPESLDRGGWSLGPPPKKVLNKLGGVSQGIRREGGHEPHTPMSAQSPERERERDEPGTICKISVSRSLRGPKERAISLSHLGSPLWSAEAQRSKARTDRARQTKSYAKSGGTWPKSNSHRLGSKLWHVNSTIGDGSWTVGTVMTSRFPDSRMSHKKCDLGVLRRNPSSKGQNAHVIITHDIYIDR